MEQIWEVLATSPFVGEGHRKVWARLRWQGVRTSKARVLRLMRAAHLLASTRLGHAHGPKAHDGTITTEVPDQMWGMDATSCLTRRDGVATVFVVVDHCAAECNGLHAARPGTRFEAGEAASQSTKGGLRDECRAIELHNWLRIDDLSRSRDLTFPNPRAFRRGYYQLGVHEIGGGANVTSSGGEAVSFGCRRSPGRPRRYRTNRTLSAAPPTAVSS